jgi:hypothetical protein
VRALGRGRVVRRAARRAVGPLAPRWRGDVRVLLPAGPGLLGFGAWLLFRFLGHGIRIADESRGWFKLA